MLNALLPSARRAASAALLLTLAAGTAGAGELTLDGFVALRSTAVSSQPSWREGAFGRVTLGADSTGDEEVYAAAGVHLALDWQPSPFFGAYVHVAGRAEPGRVDYFGSP